jgi:hypothetical protein
VKGTVAFRAEDNRWWGRLSLGWKDGRRQRKTFYGATEAEVQSKLLDARARSPRDSHWQLND